MKAVIAGGSGALGRRLAADLHARDVEVVVLTRSPRSDLPHRQVQWDGRTVGPWWRELSGSIVINLAGELVDRRPTSRNIALLRRSRVDPTRALVEAAQRVDSRPPVWLQMSTLALHGDAGEAQLDECSPAADGPPQMAGVARAWEQAASDVPAHRKIVLRASVVLDTGTPALDRLSSLTRWGLGGRVGSGQQWISWLHVDDLRGIVGRCLEDDRLSGPIVASSPNPVRNHELMSELRRVLRRPPAPPTPAFLVHAGAVLLRTDPALGLTGRRAHPAKLLEAGYPFRFPTLRPALEDLLR